MIPEVVSVAVLGGGPAGSAAAFLLARAGIDVILFERAASRGSDRGEVLAGEGRSALVQMGLWDRVPDSAVTPCASMLLAWGDAVPAERYGITSPYGCGWQVARPVFDDWFLAEAAAGGAIVARPMAVTSVRRGSNGWLVSAVAESTGRHELAARVVIDARGRSSAPADWRQTARERHDALCAVVTRASDLDRASGLLVEAGPDGWWYSVPGPDGTVLAAFVTDADLVAAGGRGHAVLQRALENAPLTSQRLCFRDGPISVVSACSASLASAAGDDWLAVGDAALARDPLSGEGIVGALRSARLAARAVQDHLCGDARAFAHYADAAQRSTIEYLSARRAVYDSQPRWRDRPFWRRRQTVARNRKEGRIAHERT